MVPTLMMRLICVKPD